MCFCLARVIVIGTRDYLKSGRFRDVIVMKWSYKHRRGSSDPVLKALKF